MSIRMEGVHKAYGDKVVLRGFDLEVHDGEIVSIIGASGSGKSTTLKLVIRLIDPDSGHIFVGGHDVARLSDDELFDLRRRVGFVFQFAALFDSMTIRENVEMGLRRIPGMTPEEMADRVREALERVDLAGAGERMPSELSGGMRKRAGLARAVALRPGYLLYDEPTTGLDPITVRRVDDLIARMRDDLGATSLVITHDIESACRISDRIAMLHEGRIRAVGTVDEIRAHPDPIVRGFMEGRPELWESAQ